jgi:hypothetical protein
MTSWKDSVMSKEEFEKKEVDRIIDEALMGQADHATEWRAFMADYSSTRDEEPIIVKEGDRAKDLVLLYKIEKKLHKMGFTYDGDLMSALGVESGTKVYNNSTHSHLMDRILGAYIIKVKNGELELFRHCGALIKHNIDDFLIGEK